MHMWRGPSYCIGICHSQGVFVTQQFRVRVRVVVGLLRYAVGHVQSANQRNLSQPRLSLISQHQQSQVWVNTIVIDTTHSSVRLTDSLSCRRRIAHDTHESTLQRPSSTSVH